MKPEETAWKSGSVALTSALNLEHNVTQHIKSVIKECEESPRDSIDKDYTNDYHVSEFLTFFFKKFLIPYRSVFNSNIIFQLVDYLTDFLGEQYKSMRDIAGKISTLRKMHQNERLGEFLFDQQL